MKNSNRITFMGTPAIAVPYLESLLNNNFNIMAVYSQPARPRDRGMLVKPGAIQLFAEKNKIPLFAPSKLNNVEEIKRFEDLKNDLVIIMGYGLLIPEVFLKTSRLGFINIHLSLLPKWRGASPVEQVLLSGDKETGVTIFKLTEKLDAGPILSFKKFQITDTITKIQLQEKLTDIGTELLIKTLPNYFSGKLQLTNQNKDEATYSTKIKSSDTQIDFYIPAKQVYNKNRAFSPKPGAWFKFNKERIKILSCKIESQTGKSSRILSKDLLIGCDNKSIRPIIVQREGKKSMTVEDFIRGFAFNVGDDVN